MARVAAVQMCSSADVDENLKIATQLITTASKHGAKLVVLPEMFAIVGKKATDMLQHQETHGCGKIQDHIAATAAQQNIWIVGGTIPISSGMKNKVYATSIVYDNSGRQVANYNKINLFDVRLSANEAYKESDVYEAGTDVTVIDSPVGKLGIAVCFDLRFPLLFQQLRQKGAEVIAVPAAFTQTTGKAHWRILTCARAIDTYCYIIGAAQEGTHANHRKTYGHTSVIDPWGMVIDEVMQPGNGVIYADIDLDRVREIRRNMGAT